MAVADEERDRGRGASREVPATDFTSIVRDTVRSDERVAALDRALQREVLHAAEVAHLETQALDRLVTAEFRLRDIAEVLQRENNELKFTEQLEFRRTLVDLRAAVQTKDEAALVNTRIVAQLQTVADRLAAHDVQLASIGGLAAASELNAEGIAEIRLATADLPAIRAQSEQSNTLLAGLQQFLAGQTGSTTGEKQGVEAIRRQQDRGVKLLLGAIAAFGTLFGIVSALLYASGH